MERSKFNNDQARLICAWIRNGSNICCTVCHPVEIVDVLTDHFPVSAWKVVVTNILRQG